MPHVRLARDFVTAREAANSFGRLLDRARTTPTVITSSGKPAAVLIDVELFDEAMMLLEAEAAQLIALADAAAARADAGHALSAEQGNARIAAWLRRRGLPNLPPVESRNLAEYVDVTRDDGAPGS